MSRTRTAVGALSRRRLNLGRCPMCGPTIFYAKADWLRDHYLCTRCSSIPRQRALVLALVEAFPNWRTFSIFESSPSGPGSAWIAGQCRFYQPSQFFPGVASGEYADGVRCEDLQSLTLASGSVDIVITQDVLEHVLDPIAAFREIARVLRPGGAHVWTVPIYAGRETVVRVDTDGSPLMDPDYHDSPVGDCRSLVIREWGDDIITLVDKVSGLATERVIKYDKRLGLAGQFLDVLISRKSPDSP